MSPVLVIPETISTYLPFFLSGSFCDNALAAADFSALVDLGSRSTLEAALAAFLDVSLLIPFAPLRISLGDRPRSS